MVRRESWLPPVLTMATCGLYYPYWQYVTTDELKTATGREDLNPMMDLLLTLLCCGFYSIYVQYRNAQVIHEQFTNRQAQHEDKSTMVLLLHAVSFLNGITAFVAIMMVQDELNKLGTLLEGGGSGGGPGGGFGPPGGGGFGPPGGGFGQPPGQGGGFGGGPATF